MITAVRFAIAAAFGVATVMPAFAQDASHHDRFYRGKVDWSMSTGSDQLGSPAGDMFYDREVRLGANARGISVTHGETVKFVAADGREFRWRFDPLARVTSIPLASIAPGDMSVGQGARVYVGESDNS